jgi:hypothetical protein
LFSWAKWVFCWGRRVWFQTSLKVRFACNAQRPSKFENFVRRSRADFFWRSCSAAEILPASWNTRAAFSIGTVPTAQQRILDQRDDRISPASPHSRFGTRGNHRAASEQRCVPVLGWTSGLSCSDDPATFSSPICESGAAPVSGSARSLAEGNVVSAQATQKGYSRLRRNSAYGLRQATRLGHRLQSEEEGTPILHAAAVFRRANRGCDCGKLPTGKYSSDHGCRANSRRSVCETSWRRRTSANSWRRSFLWAQVCRICRSEKGLLRNSLETSEATPQQTWWHTLPACESRSKRRGVQIPAGGLEESEALCGNPPANSRRTFGPASSVSSGRIHLPGLCYEHGFETAESVAFLQSTFDSGTHNSRTERRICIGEDSEQGLCSERSVLSYCSFGIQSSELVQAAVRSTAMAACHASHSPPKAAVCARSVCTTWRHANVADCTRLYSSRRLHRRHETHYEDQTTGRPHGKTKAKTSRQMSVSSPNSEDEKWDFHA